MSTEIPNLMKLAGATNVASLGNGNEPASEFVAKEFAAGAQADGLKVGYQDYSIPIGSVDMTAPALTMKNLGIDAFYAPMIETTDFALLSDLQAEGATMKAAVVATGYGQEIYNQPTALKAAQGAVFEVLQVPFEDKTPATEAEQAAFEKYEHFSGLPNLNWTYGWLSADLFIRGLQEAGQNPTRTSFISGLHGVTNWDGGGLLPSNQDLSLAGFGKFPATSCGYFVRLSGNNFVPLNNGQRCAARTWTREPAADRRLPGSPADNKRGPRSLQVTGALLRQVKWTAGAAQAPVAVALVSRPDRRIVPGRFPVGLPSTIVGTPLTNTRSIPCGSESKRLL